MADTYVAGHPEASFWVTDVEADKDVLSGTTWVCHGSLLPNMCQGGGPGHLLCLSSATHPCGWGRVGPARRRRAAQPGRAAILCVAVLRPADALARPRGLLVYAACVTRSQGPVTCPYIHPLLWIGEEISIAVKLTQITSRRFTQKRKVHNLARHPPNMDDTRAISLPGSKH
ncbi:hypothetical protein SKAU_G00162920 [Synaphobranchus kaupii]|uniref:Uncharacterized protein n=1 Tax=Synaphobranchus kaupii TaxID=118154 RepID=A0A9Q1FIV7_SYNKA|nr:hypothetical protein SKAU_G00162920 [Synaphobranchus kaupii]